MDKEITHWKFFSLNTLCIAVVVCVLNVIIWLSFHGVPLVGLPQAEDVKSISVIKNSSQEREVTTQENIKLLVNAAKLLNYRLLGETEGSPIITVTYHLKDGDDVTIKANNTSMWWHGKSHPIKKTDTFINIVQGLYFDLAE